VSVAVEPRVSSRARETFERTVEAHTRCLPDDMPSIPSTVVGSPETWLMRVSRTWPVRVARRSGEAAPTVWRLTFMQLREAMLASGLATPPEIHEAVALCDDPGFGFLSQLTMTASGRRSTRD
jgi:hypothetical protein